MVPGSITSTAPQAGFWSHLRTIDNTLQRISESPDNTCSLDLDRLQALKQILNETIQEVKQDESLLNDFFFNSVAKKESSYFIDIDLREHLKEISSFKEWHKSKGFKNKINDLISIIDTYSATSELLRKDFPSREMEILQEIILHLLIKAEINL